MSQTQKAALGDRVRVDQSTRLWSNRQNLGEGMMCPAGAGDLGFDIFGRPADQNTLLVDDSACSNFTKWSTGRRIEVENMERPYVPICASGNRGAADLMGVGRDLLPQNVYGEGYGGNMVRHYTTRNNFPPSQEPPRQMYYQKQIQPTTFSHDATGHLWRG